MNHTLHNWSMTNTHRGRILEKVTENELFRRYHPHAPPSSLCLRRYMLECEVDLNRKYKMDLLPGGEKCALSCMDREARPFVGPNLYVTPRESLTPFLQAGNGTVDSAYQCLHTCMGGTAW